MRQLNEFCFDIKFNKVKLNVAYDCVVTQKTNETLTLCHSKVTLELNLQECPHR